MLKTLMIGALLAFAGGGALAQQKQVYRCGSTYGEQPCQGATLVQAVQRPSDSDARQAESAAKRDARLADSMEKARLAQEARAPKAIIIGGTDKPASAKATQTETGPAKLHKGKKPEHFTATSPRPPGEVKKKKS